MNDDKSYGNKFGRSRSLIALLIVALSILLTVTASRYLSSKAQGVLAGVVCGVGVMITVGMLVIFIRQYERGE